MDIVNGIHLITLSFALNWVETSLCALHVGIQQQSQCINTIAGDIYASQHLS